MAPNNLEHRARPYLFSIGIGAASGAGKSTTSALIRQVLQNAIKRASVEVGQEILLDRSVTEVRIAVQDSHFIPPNDQKWPFIQLPDPASSGTQSSITVPDRECVEAINFANLHAEVLRTGTTGWDDTSSQINSMSPLTESLNLATSILQKALMCCYTHWRDAGSVDGPFFKIRPEDGLPTLSCSFTIVEGHLILAQPSEKLPDDAEYRVFVAKQRGEQDDLKRLIDVKLFLPVSKETSFQRRFQRPAYQDRSEANPEGRLPEHFWAYKPYFEHVFASYTDLHRHLLSSANPEKDHGVHVRPESIDSLGDTLVWCSHVIAQAIMIKEGTSDI
ncbi:hypothetical protein SLS62_006610 [Diatrype stigma]|uniref:Uridine kinase n=1 Tax=Diatrype stigma TaxID=117547 RepID=A0AAN9V0Z3_9PEZI